MGRVALFLNHLLLHLMSPLSSNRQVHLSVSQVSVSLSVDCQRVGERPARPLGSLPTDGFEMLGKLVKTRGPNSGSAPVLLLCPVLFLPSLPIMLYTLNFHPVISIVSSSNCSPLRSSVTPHGLQRTPAVTCLHWSVSLFTFTLPQSYFGASLL